MLNTKKEYLVLLNIIVLFLQPSLCAVTLKDLPTECTTAKVLADETRAWDKIDTPTSTAQDVNLKKGWYRILANANSLKQGFDNYLTLGSVPPRFCGATYPGTLMGDHPTVDEGLVEMTVCFRRRHCFYKSLKVCECTFNKTVYVRNCINHYIYWLSPTGSEQRYCTGRTSLSGPKATHNASMAIECKEYTYISSKSSRTWDKISAVTCDKGKEGWHRFGTDSGLEIASNCSVNKELITRWGQPCGAGFRGWMVDQHPTIEQGRVQRRICFSYPDKCVCEFFSSVGVRNCGGFYVYRLNGVPTCESRYCGAAKNSLAAVNDKSKPSVVKSKNLCEMYQVRHDPDRLWSYTSPTVSKCDADLYGKYRFGSKYTPWTIREGCNQSEMLVTTHRCGTDYQGYMEGKHPTVKEEIVERIICFQTAKAACECHHTTIVRVQNCGTFFVYEFKGVPLCSSRFCVVANNSAEITIDADRSPLYEIPVPGYTPKVEKVEKDKDDNSGMSTVIALSVVIFIIVLVILIIIILLIIFIIRPLYKERKPKQQRISPRNSNVCLALQEDEPIRPKPSTSNGSLPQEEKLQVHEDTTIPPYPSMPPPGKPVEAPTVPEDDSEIEMRRGPASDDDLNTIPEDTEYSDNNDEYDTLMKKEDTKKPKSYEHSHKDSAV